MSDREGCATLLAYEILRVDNCSTAMLNWCCCPTLVPIMTNKQNTNRINEALIKFVAPIKLKSDLQDLAYERNITLSALLRLITSEYVKRNRSI